MSTAKLKIITQSFSFKILAIFTIFFCFSIEGFSANNFSTAYINFALPDNWVCYLEQTEYVCRSKKENESKEAIIIFTAKQKGPTDSINQYVEHLSAPKQFINEKNQKFLSSVTLKPKLVNFNNTQWVDALHFNSEVLNYYTRYLATVKDNIAIIVTFTAHKDVYTKYQSLFNLSVATLKTVKPQSHELPLSSGSNPGFAQINPGGGISDPMILDPFQPEKKSGSSSKMMYIGLALVLAAVGLFLLIKARKK